MEATPGERKTLAAMASLCSGPISCQSTRTPGEGSTVKAAGKAMSGDLQTDEAQGGSGEWYERAQGGPSAVGLDQVDKNFKAMYYHRKNFL